MPPGFWENTSAKNRPLEVAKNLHMLGPIGKTACAIRLRPAMRTFCICGGIVSASEGWVILGKFGNKLLTKNSQKIFLNHLTLRKFGAYRPWSRRSQIKKDP